MEIHSSARRHGIADGEILHAIDHAIDHAAVIDDLGEDPDRWLLIGADRAANLIEIVVLLTLKEMN